MAKALSAPGAQVLGFGDFFSIATSVQVGFLFQDILAFWVFLIARGGNLESQGFSRFGGFLTIITDKHFLSLLSRERGYDYDGIWILKD